MATEPLRYFLDLGPSRYECKTVQGEEGLSQTARFEVTFHVADTDPLDPDSFVSGPAYLVLSRASAQRSIMFYVTDIRRGATRKIRGGRAGGGLVRVVLEPRLAMLRKRSDIRVFRDKTAPQIVTEVLEAMGVSVEARLADAYVKRPYCVQFRESDYDFAARLLEDEGIFYFVDDDGMVVIGDQAASYDDNVANLPFRFGAGLDQNEDSIHAIGQRGKMTAGKVSLRDFNHEHPSADMDVSSTGPTEGGAEWYDYPGEYLDKPEGQIKAKKRTEALGCVHRRMVGKSFCAPLRPGARFALSQAPSGVSDGGYVVTKVNHDFGRSTGGFLIGLEFLPETTVYRPELNTPVPVEPNPLTGFTTGPSGADIYPNEWGHVKVWFPWDRLRAKMGDPEVSHWVPILQDNTGRSSAIMRTDWEVVCQFMEGDPDRPVVVGRVFNGFEMQHTPLPYNKTRTSMRSLTSPRTIPGENYIQFEDADGRQEIMIGACRDQNIVVANDKNEQTNEVEGHTVDGNETIEIGNDMKLGVQKTLTLRTSGNQEVEVGGDQTIEVGESFDENVSADNELTIEGDHTHTAALSDMTQVKANLTEKITGDVKEQSTKSNTTTVGKESKLMVKGSHTEKCKKSKMETIGEEREETIGGDLMETAGKEIATRIEEKRKLKVGKDVKVNAIMNVLLAGAKQLRGKMDIGSMTGNTTITLKVGDTEIKLQDNHIQLIAPQDISIKMTGENHFKADAARQDRPR